MSATVHTICTDGTMRISLRTPEGSDRIALRIEEGNGKILSVPLTTDQASAVVFGFEQQLEAIYLRRMRERP